MPRLCFVIMPFSDTESCSAEEWTDIFERLFKPAVEAAGLDYECRRSEATRGNMIAAIVRSLREAHVVLADLTDQNPNVFYELGVRHALRDRTILVAQNRSYIPFDLSPYANHVYDWRTDRGRQELTTRVKELLEDVDAEPDRPDNPVSDFLTRSVEPAAAPTSSEEVRQPIAENLERTALVGSESSATAGSEVGRLVSADKNLTGLRNLVRPARRYFGTEWPYKIEEMDGEHPLGRLRIDEADRMPYATELIARFEADTEAVEAFALRVVEAGWPEGTHLVLRIVGDWLSIAADHRSKFKAIQGSPAVCALRLLSLMGTKALSDEVFPTMRTIAFSPIESLDLGRSPSSLSLADRRDLLHPAALFGLADLATEYLSGLFNRGSHIQPFFVDESDYHRHLVWFLLFWGFAHDLAPIAPAHPLYPGYKLLPDSREAVESLSERLRADAGFRQGIASIFDETADQFSQRWRNRAERQNSADLGSRYFPIVGGPHLPEDLFE